MKKLFALVIVLFIVAESSALAAQRFRDFPAEGICTGDYVRYRSDPDTEDSEVLGRLFTGDRVTVLSQTSIDGEIWYEIENPEDDEESAWVYGKYIRPARR